MSSGATFWRVFVRVLRETGALRDTRVCLSHRRSPTAADYETYETQG